MQTIPFFCSGIRIRITGYSFKKSWKLTKNMLESFLHQGKKATYSISVLIIRFRQFGTERKNSNFFESFSESSETRKNLKRKKSFFPLSPKIRMKNFALIRIRKKNADPKHCNYLKPTFDIMQELGISFLIRQ